MPNTAVNKYDAAIAEESIFRKIGTAFKVYDAAHHILAKDYDDLAQFVPEGGNIPIFEGINDFTPYSIESHKLAAFVKMNTDFVHDATFDIEDHLVKRFAKNFANAEDKAFINGTGEQMPTGILDATKGAVVGKTTDSITYDDIINLYFSLRPEYRKNAVWLMNDETALELRSLKDSAGNYLWRDSDDTILSKKVVITEFMPNAESDNKPIAFGDFSYYWIIGRRPVSVKTLIEKFALLDQIGYLAFEFIDGKLIRRDAVKVIQMNTISLSNKG
ncbi:MAG: phage major capsid protein [Oscillospiraceae bacterium]